MFLAFVGRGTWVVDLGDWASPFLGLKLTNAGQFLIMIFNNMDQILEHFARILINFCYSRINPGLLELSRNSLRALLELSWWRGDGRMAGRWWTDGGWLMDGWWMVGGWMDGGGRAVGGWMMSDRQFRKIGRPNFSTFRSTELLAESSSLWLVWYI